MKFILEIKIKLFHLIHQILNSKQYRLPTRKSWSIRMRLSIINLILFLVISGLSPQEKGLKLISQVPGENKGNRWGIIVGVNYYEDSEIPSLNKAVNDSEGFYEVLKTFGQFSENRLILMNDKAKERDLFPTKNKIEQKIDYVLDMAEPDDLIIFYFSGHGITDKKTNRGYLIPSDASNKKVFQSSISIEEIVTQIKSKGIKKSILMLDACRNELQDGKKSVGGGIDGLSSKIFQNAEVSATFYSTRDSYFSYEDHESDYGVYTRFLMEGIKGGGDLQEYGGNGDGVVSFKELQNFVGIAVDEWSLRNKKKQKPLTKFTREIFGDIAVSLVNKMPIKDIKVSVQPGKLPSSADNKNFKNSIGMEFALIPIGSFDMGCSSGDTDCESDESPQHKVTLTRSFYLGIYEVTQGQWNAIMGNNPSYFPKCGENCPVEQVSWDEIQIFIQKLNSKEGTNTYRLPTEAEWEYAARAGTKTRYYWGNTIDSSYLYYEGSSGKGTHQVGQKKPNGFGLYDMSGNVWEWVQDIFDESYYKNSSSTHPGGADLGTYRVSRGGSWYNDSRMNRISYRNNHTPDYRFYNLGFRIAKSL